MGNVIGLDLGWLWAALAGLAALVVAWVAGRRSGAVRAKMDDLEQNVEALEGRNEVDNRISADPDPKRRILRDWSR